MATPARRIYPNYVEQYASVVYRRSSREELPFDSHVPEVARHRHHCSAKDDWGCQIPSDPNVYHRVQYLLKTCSKGNLTLREYGFQKYLEYTSRKQGRRGLAR